jgi:hypothetical protein
MLVFGRAMRMPVDEAGVVVLTQQVIHCISTHIHDVHRFDAFRLFALRAQLFDLGFTLREWLS